MLVRERPVHEMYRDEQLQQVTVCPRVRELQVVSHLLEESVQTAIKSWHHARLAPTGGETNHEEVLPADGADTDHNARMTSKLWPRCLPDSIFKRTVSCSQLTKCQSELKEQITTHTRLSRRHLTPEIALHLLTPECPLYHSPAEVARTRAFATAQCDPFWAIYWPGGQGLARYILDYPSTVKNRRVLDVGSGCGACAFAASLSGAAMVQANDIDQAAIQAIELNGTVNNLPTVTVSKVDFLSDAGESMKYITSNFDVLLLGDLLFDEELGGTVMKLCSDFMASASSKSVLVGDPGRWMVRDSSFREKANLHCLAKYELSNATKAEHYGLNSCFVYAMMQ